MKKQQKQVSRKSEQIKGKILDGDTVITQDADITIHTSTEMLDTTTFAGPSSVKGKSTKWGIFELPYDPATETRIIMLRTRTLTLVGGGKEEKIMFVANQRYKNSIVIKFIFSEHFE